VRRLTLIGAFALIVALAMSAVAPAATSTDQKQNERISKLEANSATKTELAAVKKELNERISQLVTRVNSIEAHDNGQDPKIAALEAKVAELGKGSGGEPPIEEPSEPPVEEPVEEPPVEEPHEEPPAQTLHCFSNPAACGFPAPSNTGTSGTLAPSGSINASTAGQTISGKSITGVLTISANNVTVENVQVTQNTTCGGTSTCGNYAIHVLAGVTGAVIKNVETATESGKTCEHDIRVQSGASVRVVGSYLHACDSNIYDAGTAVLEDSYGIGKLVISEDHVENIYFEGSFTAKHDTLLNPIGQTAVIFGNDGGGNDVTNCGNKLTVEGNLLAGGGYTIYPCAHAAQTGSSVVKITNNHFARCTTTEVYNPNGGTHTCKSGPDSNGYYPHSGDYGLETNYFGTQAWSGNVWDDSGAAINPGS
jgi:TolA-binding protein